MYNAVGIDASKLKSTITIVQPAGVVIRKPFDVLHTSDELNTLVTYLKSLEGETRAGRTPYDVALENYGIDILKALQLRPIPPDEVNLTPKLIRFNHYLSIKICCQAGT